jgi:hypothetical protein
MIYSLTFQPTDEAASSNPYAEASRRVARIAAPRSYKSNEAALLMRAASLTTLRSDGRFTVYVQATKPT